MQRRTLQDTVTLTGTLARQELRKVTTVAQGRVERGVREGRFDRARAASKLFAIDGRDAIAEAGIGALLPPARRR